MMQFECRVWDTYRSKMLYGYDELSVWNGLLVLEGDSILLLGTGIKDVKGNKSYQMDIIEANGAVMVLVWHMGAIVAVDEEYILEGKGNYSIFQPLADIGPFKVIGNLFEHKSLLRRFQ